VSKKNRLRCATALRLAKHHEPKTLGRAAARHEAGGVKVSSVSGRDTDGKTITLYKATAPTCFHTTGSQLSPEGVERMRYALNVGLVAGKALGGQSLQEGEAGEAALDTLHRLAVIAGLAPSLAPEAIEPTKDAAGTAELPVPPHANDATGPEVPDAD